MKIAIFTDTFTPQVNGVVTSTKSFAAEFEKQGHEVLILGPKINSATNSTDKVWRLRSFPYPFQQEYRLIIPMSRKLKEFKARNFDIIHAQTPFSLGYLAQFLGRKYNIPVVHTYHTFFAEYLHYVPIIPQRYLQKYASMESRKFCNRCSAIIAPSQQMKEKLQDYQITAPIEVIPTGVDLSRLEIVEDKAVLYQKLNLNPLDILLIFAGRLGQEKNVYFLLDSFKKVLEQVPAAFLLIAGDGPEKQNLMEKAQELGIFSRIKFAGYVDHKLLFTAFAASRVMMFPSKTETQGLTVIESMAMGTPVVGINKMGVADILANHNGGFLCEENLEEYSQKVVDLILDEQLYQEKKKQAFAVAQNYSSATLAKKMLAVYQHILSERRSA
jgi:glycosyltransferase involved in cell wall biosynthesis